MNRNVFSVIVERFRRYSSDLRARLEASSRRGLGNRECPTAKCAALVTKYIQLATVCVLSVIAICADLVPNTVCHIEPVRTHTHTHTTHTDTNNARLGQVQVGM